YGRTAGSIWRSSPRMVYRLPPCVALRMGRPTRPTTPAIILRTRNSALALSCLRHASGRPSHGALPLLTSCVAMSPTNIGLAPPISRSPTYGPVPPVRYRGRVYELRLAPQPSAAPPRHVERA